MPPKPSAQKTPFLPDHIKSFFAKRVVDCLAITLGLISLFWMMSILSYSAADASLNTTPSSSESVANWGGAFGAYISDIAIQTLGISSLLLGFALLSWAVSIYRRHSFALPLSLRISFLLISLLCFATASVVFHESTAQQILYWGGFLGLSLYETITGFLFPFIGQISYGFTTFIAATFGTILFCMALGYSKAFWITALKTVIALVKFSALQIAAAFYACTKWIRHYDSLETDDPFASSGDSASANKTKREKFKWPFSKSASNSAENSSPIASSSTPASSAPSSQPQISSGTRSSSTQTSSPMNANTAPNTTLNTAANTAPNINAKIVAPTASPEKSSTSLATQKSISFNELSEWELPPASYLQEAKAEDISYQLDERALQRNAEMLQQVLNDFGVQGEITKIRPGPVVTLYELEPAPGIKSSKVIGLSDDIARSMSAISVRAAVVPGRSVIGIEIPNQKRQIVYLRSLVESSDYHKTKSALPLILGKDIGGGSVIADLAKMPHLLIAGTTGAGKSVAINTMILSLLYALSPDQCRMIMIDPKMLELSVYDDIPHLLSPVVTDPGRAVVALKWAVQEMENRYRSMSKFGVRNIDGYNQRIRDAIKKGEDMTRKVQTGYDPESGKPVFEDEHIELKELPYIVIIVDEFADLMLVAGKDVESAIQRLAQMARAAGIHLIMATQRPSVDVITGVIKANFPTRISFQVTSKFDSRTILGEGGAEQLLGMGDMLYMASGGKIQRVHGPFVADDEVEQVVQFVKEQGEPEYLDDIEGGEGNGLPGLFDGVGGEGGGGSDVDELYDEAVALVAREGKASTSFIQRHLQIGYNRAARIIEEMESQGVVGAANHVGKREVMVGDHSVQNAGNRV